MPRKAMLGTSQQHLHRSSAAWMGWFLGHHAHLSPPLGRGALKMMQGVQCLQPRWNRKWQMLFLMLFQSRANLIFFLTQQFKQAFNIIGYFQFWRMSILAAASWMQPDQSWLIPSVSQPDCWCALPVLQLPLRRLGVCCYNLPFDRPVTSVAHRFTFLFQIEPFMVFASLIESWSKASTFDNLNSNPMSRGANNRRIYSRSLIYAGGWGSKLPYTNKGNSRWQFLLLLPWLVVAKWVLDFEVCILCWFLMQPCECSEKWNAIALPSISSNPFIAVESRTTSADVISLGNAKWVTQSKSRKMFAWFSWGIPDCSMWFLLFFFTSWAAIFKTTMFPRVIGFCFAGNEITTSCSSC